MYLHLHHLQNYLESENKSLSEIKSLIIIFVFIFNLSIINNFNYINSSIIILINTIYYQFNINDKKVM